MSVASPCDICGSANANHACDRCGQLVCSDHFEESLGFCVECAAEVAGERSDQPTEEDKPDGVDTYRF